jgi:hypothetical protein
MMPKRNIMVRILFIFSFLVLGTVHAQEEQSVQALQDEVTQLRAQLDALRAQVTMAILLSAVQHLDAAEFHTMDETLHAGELNPRYLTTVRHAITTTSAVTWPVTLQEQATTFIEAAQRLEGALADEDIEAAAQAAAETHDAQHVLSSAIFAHLAGEEGAHGDHAHGAGTSAPQVPEDAVRVELQLNERGGVAGRPATFRVNSGNTVALIIQSAAEGSLHLHGYGVEVELHAGEEVVLAFTANSTGRFPLEVHPAGQDQGVVVGYIEVHP